MSASPFRRSVLLLVVFALAAFGLAACGDSDDSGETTSETAATTEETTAADSGGGGAAGTLAISADPGGQLAFTESELETSAGDVEIDFDNPSSTTHDVRIESESGEDVGGTDTIASSTATADVTLEPGTYTYYCSVDSHREAGMEGTLTVK